LPNQEYLVSPPRRFRWGFVALGLLLVGLIVWLAIAAGRKPPPRQAPAPPVSVATVSVRDQPIYLTALGAAQAWQGVLINPQINGRLTYVASEGEYVQAGALLVRIDCAPYEATLTQAQGALARDSASLAEARVDLKRYEDLLAQKSIAGQTVDQQRALVKQDEGVVLADRGAVAAAQTNVRYCSIPSPISGRVGVRLIDPGNIVTTGTTTGIVSVNQIEPIAVTFTVPQGDFQRLVEATHGFTDRLPTEAFSQETGADLGSGELVVTDNHVDPTTGTVAIKARFANAGRQIWPGQFVNVRVTLQTLSRAVVTPTSAVNQGPKGPFAYVVGADGRAAMRPVALLSSQGGVTIVQSGLRAGEQVVTDGQMALRPGMPVTIVRPSAARLAGP
jgi:multidrug efflux system membrane fusion protein